MPLSNINKYKNELLIFFVGFALMLVNFIMVKHVSIALRKMEVAVLVFTLAYFVGISLGYYFSDKLNAVTIKKYFPVIRLIFAISPPINTKRLTTRLMAVAPGCY